VTTSPPEACGLLSVIRRVHASGESERLSDVLYKDERLSGWREHNVYRLPGQLDVLSIVSYSVVCPLIPPRGAGGRPAASLTTEGEPRRADATLVVCMGRTNVRRIVDTMPRSSARLAAHVLLP
jgi:hypothetical protein